MNVNQSIVKLLTEYNYFLYKNSKRNVNEREWKNIYPAHREQGTGQFSGLLLLQLLLQLVLLLYTTTTTTTTTTIYNYYYNYYYY